LLNHGEIVGSYSKLQKLVNSQDKFVLICHVEPDGDSIGSMLALGEGLSGFGKEVSYVCKDVVPPTFNFLVEGANIQDGLVLDGDAAIILLDNGDMRRTGFVEELQIAKADGVVIVNLDHHTKNDLWRFVSINYADETASSTCEIVYRLFLGFGWQITPRIATLLLSGLYNDTGGFRHPNTSDAVLILASELLKKGGKLKRIAENIENSKSVALFKLWGIALDRLRLNEKLGLSYSLITQADILRAGATEDDISGLVNLLNSAPESKAALLLYESETGKIKGSLRTERDDIDLAELARYLGGGGHKKAAGFSLDGRIEKVDGEWRVV
jgi:phosphoesterase RecJ-like protein